MSLTDPLGDMLTRIRNAQKARKANVSCPTSNLLVRVADVLKTEGYIRDHRVEDGMLVMDLKYQDQGQPVIRRVERVSRPGLRRYSGAKKMPRVYSGLGIAIVSTPKGVMSDQQARDANVGGEVLCTVF